MAGRGLNDPGDAAAEVPCRPQAKRGIADGGRASGGDPDRLSNGRALFNLVTGSDPAELAGDGVFLDHTERYEASAEFTHIWRKLMEGETVTFNGKHQRVRDAKLLFPPLQQPRPPLYFGGSSEVAQELAAEQVDLYLTRENRRPVAEKIAQVREKAARHGRRAFWHPSARDRQGNQRGSVAGGGQPYLPS